MESKEAPLLGSGKIVVWAKMSEEERPLVDLDMVATNTQHSTYTVGKVKKVSTPSAITSVVPRH